MLAGEELRGPIMSERGGTAQWFKSLKAKVSSLKNKTLQKTYPSQRCVCCQGNDHVGLTEVVDLRGEENKTQWGMKSLRTIVLFQRRHSYKKQIIGREKVVISSQWEQSSERNEVFWMNLKPLKTWFPNVFYLIHDHRSYYPTTFGKETSKHSGLFIKRPI